MTSDAVALRAIRYLLRQHWHRRHEHYMRDQIRNMIARGRQLLGRKTAPVDKLTSQS